MILFHELLNLKLFHLCSYKHKISFADYKMSKEIILDILEQL